MLDSKSGRANYQYPIRSIHFYVEEQNRHIRILTNNFDLSAITICMHYMSPCQVELFCKWIKQHLRTKPFYGTSEHAVKSQIWVAISM